ncbi:MAG: GAF domain-containing protein [Flavobacteriales bacterium]|nr:GAF domain-containing protein [Flavobacteriales bacterium]
MATRKKKAESNSNLPSAYKHAELMGKIGKSITSSLSVEKIIETVYENINTLLDATVFAIGVYDKEHEQLVFKGAKEKGKIIPVHVVNISDRNELSAWCFNNRKKIVINNLEEEFGNYINKNMEPIVGGMTNSIIYVPLTSKRKTVGVITCQSFKNNAYSRYHINVLRNIAIYTSVALENARLYEVMEGNVNKRTEELQNSQGNIKILSEIGRQLTSTMDFETIFNKLHKNVNQLMEADVFGVRIYHKDRNTIEYKFEMEKGKRHPILEVSMEDDDNYSVWCVKNRKEIFINENLKEHKKYTNKIVIPAGEMPHSVIFYPMMHGRRVVGVITAQSFKTNAYTKYHLEILKTLSSYTAIALENAKIYESLEEKVIERTKELKLKNQELERLSIVASETDNYVIITDKHDKIEWVNAGFTRITGYRLQDVKGKTPAEVLRGKDTGKKDENNIYNRAKTKKQFTSEILNYKKDGTPLWLYLNVTPILNKKNQIVRYVALGSDITRLKLSEEEVVSQNVIIAKKNKDITSSIHYAKRIQEAILPLKEEVFKHLKKAFILYKPKDIVSGDFYWFSSVVYQGRKLDLIAAVDCTGHGVPGAFMSLIGNNLLNHIVNTKKEVHPDRILELMHTGILKSLHKGGDSPDGMEIALCVIDQKNKVLEYAGAGRSLIAFQNGRL